MKIKINEVLLIFSVSFSFIRVAIRKTAATFVHVFNFSILLQIHILNKSVHFYGFIGYCGIPWSTPGGGMHAIDGRIGFVPCGPYAKIYYMGWASRNCLTTISTCVLWIVHKLGGFSGNVGGKLYARPLNGLSFFIRWF